MAAFVAVAALTVVADHHDAPSPPLSDAVAAPNQATLDLFETSLDEPPRLPAISRGANRAAELTTGPRSDRLALAVQKAERRAEAKRERIAAREAAQRRAERKAARKAAAQAAAQERREEAAEAREAAALAAQAAAVDPGSLRDMARNEMIAFGFAPDQWTYLDQLIARESGWNPHATNPSSGAYGLPQALPGSKMASEGPDWRDNPVTQVRWMLAYIAARYGTPSGAWAHSQSVGWY